MCGSGGGAESSRAVDSPENTAWQLNLASTHKPNLSWYAQLLRAVPARTQRARARACVRARGVLTRRARGPTCNAHASARDASRAYQYASKDPCIGLIETAN